MRNELLPEIEAFLAQTGLSPSRFGILAASNARLVERLREGRPILTSTEAAVRTWMATKGAERIAKVETAA